MKKLFSKQANLLPVYVLLRPLAFAKWSSKVWSLCQHAAILVLVNKVRKDVTVLSVNSCLFIYITNMAFVCTTQPVSLQYHQITLIKDTEECVMFEVSGSRRFKLRIQTRTVRLSMFPAAKYVGRTRLTVEQIRKVVDTYKLLHRYYTFLGTNCQSFVNWLAYTILQYPTTSKLSDKGKDAIIHWLEAREQKDKERKETKRMIADIIVLIAAFCELIVSYK